MKIETRNTRGVTIIEPKGRITIEEGTIALRSAISEALEAGALNILINLGGLSAIDSSGIGELVSAYTSVNNRGGKLKLVSVPSKVIEITQITQLKSKFEVYENEAQAINSFSTPSRL
jgi:anti-sigma B factor antagonist